MEQSKDTMVPVESQRDTVMTLGYQMSLKEIRQDIRETMEPSRDTLMTLGYQPSHQEILFWH